MSGESTQEDGKVARFRTALSHLWLPFTHSHAPFSAFNAAGCGSHIVGDPPSPDAGDRQVLFTPDGQALCAWRLLEPGHVT